MILKYDKTQKRLKFDIILLIRSWRKVKAARSAPEGFSLDVSEATQPFWKAVGSPGCPPAIRRGAGFGAAAPKNHY
jgi:hypothetical protein